MTANLPAYIIESDQIGTPKEESLVMLTQLRADCAFPGSLECLSFRALARTSEDLTDHYQPTDGPPCRLYPLSLAAISETLAGKRQGPPAFDFVASYVLSCLRRAAGQCPGRRDQSTTILAYWENIHAAHATDAAAEAAKRDARRHALNDAPDSARRTAYALPQHQQDFLLTHGPYATVPTG